jgi:hypothetical protein
MVVAPSELASFTRLVGLITGEGVVALMQIKTMSENAA